MTDIVSNRIKVDFLNNSGISLYIWPEKEIRKPKKQYLKRYKINNLFSIIKPLKKKKKKNGLKN